MAKLFTAPDGRLKSGRISFLVFSLLVLVGSLLFKLQKPMDEAVVLVRHVFEAPAPQPAAPAEPAAEKQPPPNDKAVAFSKAEADPAGPEMPAEEKKPKSDQPPADEDRQFSAKAEAGKISAEAAAALPALPEMVESEAETSSPDPPDPGPAAEKLVVRMSDPASSAPPEAASAPEITPPVAADAKPEPTAKSELAENRISQENIGPDPVAQWTAGSQAVSSRLMNAAALERLREAAANNHSMTSAPDDRLPQITMSQPETTRSAAVASADHTEAKEAVANNPDPLANHDCDDLVVTAADYKRLHNDWRRLGGEGPEPPSRIGLQIENLRQAYRYFQMKPVVRLANGRCYDLSDGSCLPETALGRYSQTVIEVSRPWSKWGSQLQRLGLDRNSSFVVRYYMLPFIKKALYARAYQAYQAQLNKGMLQQVRGPEEVDILGRAYVIKQQGGGAFGVFLPHSLHLADGRRQTLDSEIFAADSDVKSLRRAGVIGRHT